MPFERHKRELSEIVKNPTGELLLFQQVFVVCLTFNVSGNNQGNNMQRLVGSLLTVGCLVLAASCGSTDKNKPGGGAGSTAVAGSSSTTAGTDGSSETSNGGATNAGGSTGTAGSTNPGSGEEGGDDQGPGNFGCPEAKPEDATECMRAFPTACTYDDGGCLCVDDVWDCYSDADCPGGAPDDAAACDRPGMVCGYDGDLNCTCSEANGWQCVTPCPDTTPADGLTCRRPTNQTCRYAEGAIVQGFGGGDTTCACSDGAFGCFSEADCPESAPENESACTFPTLACPYDDRDCRCQDGAWTCTTDCPEATPADGAACLRSENQACRYLEGAVVSGFGSESDTTCRCEESAFNCFGQEDCPAAAPTTGAACEFATLACDYEGSECTCGTDGTWTCVTDCPAAVPAQAAACSRPENAVCRYNDGALATGGFGAAEALCTCRAEQFECITEADCPATVPADEDACTGLNNLSCSYTDSTCTCGQDVWSCQTECPTAPPADGAACDRPAFSPCGYTGGATAEPDTDPETTCVCSDGAFSCYSAADCPATQPENDAACESPGLECAFGEQNCRCRTSTSAWSCAAAPAQGGGGGTAGTGTAGSSGTAGSGTAGSGTGGSSP